MTWIKLDDHWDEHPKMLAVGMAGRALWLAGLSYSARNLCDGFITEAAMRNLRARAGVKGSKSLIALESAGLWHRVEGGWMIHDYDQYQPTKAQVMARKRARSEAGKRGAEARWGDAEQDGKHYGNLPSDAMANGMAKDMAKLCPVPSRTHVVTSSGPSSSSTDAREADDDDDPIGQALTRIAEARWATENAAGRITHPRRKRTWITRAVDDLRAEHNTRISALTLAGHTQTEIATMLEPGGSTRLARQRLNGTTGK